MLFFAGMGYLIYINQASQAVVQANAARQGAELTAGKESLAPKVTLTTGAAPNYLVVSVNNTGGTSSVISYVYVTGPAGRDQRHQRMAHLPVPRRVDHHPQEKRRADCLPIPELSCNGGGRDPVG
jgi:hypothetical protein